MNTVNSFISRRQFLGTGARVTVAATLGFGMAACARIPAPEDNTTLLVPEGFTARIVARSGYQSSSNSDYSWHHSPDGGGCFATPDGGWIYVSNSEHKTAGGVGALRFDSNGRIQDSYSILSGTRKNCSGGETPWGTWLSCEEVPSGRVWECDPTGVNPARQLPGLGVCSHESAGVDPQTHQVYLTEDRENGCFYRFTPGNPMIGAVTDLADGVLQVAVVDGSQVSWINVPDPHASSEPLRDQVKGATRFKGGEGVDIYDGYLRFATKIDNKIWEIDLRSNQIRVLYELKDIIAQGDDLLATPGGDLLVAEDGIEMRLMHFMQSTGAAQVLLQLPHHKYSEVTGLAFAPGGSRLYFSSQRGNTDDGKNGITFELTGDFHNLNPDLQLVEWNLDHRQISNE